MKNLLLLITGMTFLIFVSCEKKPNEELNKPFPIGTWRTNYQYRSLTVDKVNPPSALETIKEEMEREVSGAISEAESYKLTFDEGGIGSGSVVHPEEKLRHNFNFTWQLSGDKLTIGAESGSDDLFFLHAWNISGNMDGWTTIGYVIWKREESSNDNMVLSTFWTYQGRITDGAGIEWDATDTYRYTFEKIKEK